MYLSGLIHRDRLFDLASRWLADRTQRDDGRILTEIFAFERAITSPVVRSLVGDLARTMRPGELRLTRVSSKDDVRRAIVAAARSAGPSPRVEQLLARYGAFPEEFFPRTPVHMSLVTRSDGSLVGMVRRKRIRRIADKVSRRVADQLADEIDAAARSLAAARAGTAGLPLDVMISSRQQMDEDFAAAERIVADRIRTGELAFDPDRVRVDDVIGVKILGTADELARIEAALDGRDGTFACESEVHEGSYAGTHYLVDLELPPLERILAGFNGVDWRFAEGRGLSSFHLEESLIDYLESASPTFRLELILTNIEDLVESEFGRCIHEVRILDQRDRAAYSGRIAQNASSIIEYMLQLAISPTVRVDSLPIKIWGRYLRDTVAEAVARLKHDTNVEWLVPTDPSSVIRL
ncbi:MAG: hypothetical protein MUC56_03040 [Thermoanaerobaculales bacterium]|jgi:hypothetical protein|nr:hypothetical protein [Thermoanaerobaculales bacterium]